MKILVTGSKGFIGRNLVSQLENISQGKTKFGSLGSDITVYKFDTDTDTELLGSYCADCDFVVHLAGVNRPKDENSFKEDNILFTEGLIEQLEKHGNNCPIVFASSIQAEFDNLYGQSKKQCEEIIKKHSEKTGSKALIYRFTNLFGKWSIPNYNSVVATFCYNIARGLPITISDRNKKIEFIYIDDLICEILSAFEGREYRDGDFCDVPEKYTVSLGELADLIYSFKLSRENLCIPDVSDGSFSKKLYSTYLSFLPEDHFSYDLRMNKDYRGSFTEILKTENHGQFSVNISKPHITKGEHWHHTKNEKFLVVSGTGVIRFRKVGEEKIIEYFVSGDRLQVVDIPVGYTHNIENLGDTDMVTFMWCNECFDPEKPDTYALKVSKKSEETVKGKKVLVLGAGGMAGHVVANYFSEQGYDVTGFEMYDVKGIQCIVGDVFDKAAFSNILTGGNYCAVINCIGLLNKACDRDYASALYLNAYLPHFLCEVLKDTDTKVIHISTDCVFSGSNSPYSETDFKDADDNYGRTKALGEIEGENHITFRTSIIGPDMRKSGSSLLNWFMSQDGKVNGFTRVMWSGVSTITLAKAMQYAVENDMSGIYNLVNNDSVSKYELVKLFNTYLNDSKTEIGENADAVSNKVLKNTRTDFGFTVPSYEEMVKETADWVNAHKELYPHYFKDKEVKENV